MIELKQDQKQFSDYWHEVEGMEDVQGLMVEFANTATDILTQAAQQDEQFLVASFMNGGMTSLMYITAELRRRLQEGEIDQKTFHTITDHMALFETEVIDKVKHPVGSTRFYEKQATKDPRWNKPEHVYFVDDIFETAGTTKALLKQYPDTRLHLMAPVVKECTAAALAEIPHTLYATKVVKDWWIDTGCGLNGGISFKDLNRYRNIQLNVMQRLANRGYWHDSAQDVSMAGIIHEEQIMSEQLPWTHLSSPNLTFELMENQKDKGNTKQQLIIAESFIDTLCGMSYDDSLAILSSSY